MTDQPQSQFDPSAPLARIEGENAKRAQALQDYWAMGAGRSLEKLAERYRQQADSDPAAKPPSRRLRTLCEWSTRFHWQARIARQVELDTEAFNKALVEKRLEIAAADLQQAGKLRDLVDEALEAGPSFVRRKVKQGRPRLVQDGVTVDEGEPTVVTLALDSKFVTSGSKTASDLARRAAGMETERKAVDLVVRDAGGEKVGGITSEDV